MSDSKDMPTSQKGLENLILLVLGADSNRISMLHLQKETFLLWNFHPTIKDYLCFIKHYKGPFSSQIEKTIRHPLFLNDCWDYESPPKVDDLSGGFIKLTKNGQNEYIRLYKEASKRESLCTLLTGIKMVRELYDQLSYEELLLLIYDTYPEYTEKSIVFDKIIEKKLRIAKNLYTKGIIDEERYNSLLEGSISA